MNFKLPIKNKKRIMIIVAIMIIIIFCLCIFLFSKNQPVAQKANNQTAIANQQTDTSKQETAPIKSDDNDSQSKDSSSESPTKAEETNQDTQTKTSKKSSETQSTSKSSQSSTKQSSSTKQNSSTKQSSSSQSSSSTHKHVWKDHTVERQVTKTVTVVDSPAKTIYGAQLYTLHDDGNWYSDGETYWFENGFTIDDLNNIIKDKIKNEGYIGNYVNRQKPVPAVTHQEEQTYTESYVDYQYCSICGARK